MSHVIRRTCHHRCSLLLVLVLGLLLCPAHALADADTLERGIAAYEVGAYVAAYEELKPHAEDGNPVAQYYLARMYDSGYGVDTDREKAFALFESAAKQGHVDAQHTVAYSYLEGISVEQDYDEAAKWYRRAAEAGDPAAQRSIGLRYKNGEGVEQDFAEAAKWFRRAAEQGDAVAAFELGEVYYYGHGDFPLDYDQALRWFYEAAHRGHTYAQYTLYSLHRQGLGGPADAELAFTWARFAAEAGHNTSTTAWERAQRLLEAEQIERIEERVRRGDMPAYEAGRAD